jgi:hypothetical protein
MDKESDMKWINFILIIFLATAMHVNKRSSEYHIKFSADTRVLLNKLVSGLLCGKDDCVTE